MLVTEPIKILIIPAAFMTEMARYAGVVLSEAIRREKTGRFTSVEKTVHISHKAIEQPGDAKADINIFLYYSRRMNFRDKDAARLIKW